MSIVIVCPNRDMSDWVTALHSVDPELHVEVWPDIQDPEAVEFVVSWSQPPNVLDQFPNLKYISSIGAGVEHLLGDATRPMRLPLVRLVDPDLKQSMAEYVMLGALEHFRRFPDYRRLQENARWEELEIPHISKIGIGIMGFGEIGGYVAVKLSDLGFRVHGFNRRRKRTGPITVYTGRSEMDEFLKRSDIIVCLLPLTVETENILSAQLFDQLPVGHPFWSHEKIAVTPHTASVTNPGSAAAQVVQNYRRAIKNKPLLNLVDIESGY